MITAIAVRMMVAGAAAIVKPDGVAGLFRRLSGRGPAAGYFYFGPETVRSSRKVRLGYAFVGCCAILWGLSVSGLIRISLPAESDLAVFLAHAFGLAHFSVLLFAGVRTLYDPMWMERWARRGKPPGDKYWKTRRVSNRLLGLIFLLIALHAVWSELRQGG